MSDFTFEFTLDHLKQIIPNNDRVNDWYSELVKLLPDYEINTPRRVASFLAQCAHESGGFRTIKENLNYQAASLMRVWPRLFPNIETANRYAHNQEAIANRAYGGRMGNGSEETGDGWKFCGRGLIQLTGKNNYSKFAESLDMTVESIPEYLSTYEGAVQSAAWFWKTNNLNIYADSDDILTMTKRINGGINGLEERKKNYEHALNVFGASD